MARSTINRGEDQVAEVVHAYELAFEPGAREAKLNASTLTPKLAADLIADLTLFVDQAKGGGKRPRRQRGEGAPSQPQSEEKQ